MEVVKLKIRRFFWSFGGFGRFWEVLGGFGTFWDIGGYFWSGLVWSGFPPTVSLSQVYLTSIKPPPPFRVGIQSSCIRMVRSTRMLPALLLLLLTPPSILEPLNKTEEAEDRDRKALSVFSVVKVHLKNHKFYWLLFLALLTVATSCLKGTMT